MSGRRARLAIRTKPETVERRPCRRWVLIGECGTEVGGTNPAKHPDRATWGVSDFDRACERASTLTVAVTVVPAWEYFGIPDPEAEAAD